ncbi:hypothetical protein MHZ95_05635 [Sporosarcina sp. ACRSM]|uniref:hypothetical protein n=1 Tax=Sporosarcina sp. ACRSM TaxID=2918216 RepID=UPI001EF5567F|nr:hypothetical protein [Sporosarcina sp. ACRSM]MCG7334765.1 hypothetical protein [Sporosarcina sp. ACRSM]
MEFQELLNKIQQSIDKMDLVSARKYIEGNIEELSANRHKLRRNARELLDFLLSNSGGEAEPLGRQDLHAINIINTYATRFDIRSLKRSVENNPNLLMREDIKYYLNTDAKILLEGMNAIQVS